MRKSFTLITFALLQTFNAFSQSADDKPAQVVENMYLMPKRGMEEKFEAAVKAHDLKYHPDGPYKAGLRKVEYGVNGGWYVWIFGPTTYGSLDTRPTKENGHDEDWSKTIDPLIETYGESYLMDFNADLSFGADIMKKSKYYELWRVDLKRGQYYRFKEVATKLKKAYETMGKTAFMVYESPIHTKNGTDIGLLWSFDTYADWSKDSGLKATIEKIYGDGSWKILMDEWNDILVDYDTEIRSFIR